MAATVNVNSDWYIDGTLDATFGNIDSGTLFVSGLTLPQVKNYDQSTAVRIVTSTGGTPYGILGDDDGNIIYTNSTGGLVQKYEVDTNTNSTIASGLTLGQGICKTDTTDFLVCDRSANAVKRVTTAGVVTTFFSTPAPYYICRANDKQSYYVFSFVSGTGVGSIIKISLAGANLGTITTYASKSILGIVQGWNGNLYTCNNTDGTVDQITLGGTKTVFCSGFTNIWTLSLLSDGRLLTSDNGTSNIMQISTAGVSSIYATVGSAVGHYADLNGNLFYSLGTQLWMKSSGDNKVLKTDLTGKVVRSKYLEDVQYLKFEDGGFSHNHNDSYEPIITAGTTAQYWRGDKTWQTLPTVTYGTDNQIPIMNAGGTAFEYTGGFTYDASTATMAISNSSAVGYEVSDIVGRARLQSYRVSFKDSASANYGLSYYNNAESFSNNLYWSTEPSSNATITIPANTSGTISLGTGTTNYLTKWTSIYTQTNSIIYDNGTNVGVGTTSPDKKFVIRTNSGQFKLETSSDPALYHFGIDAQYNYGEALHIYARGGGAVTSLFKWGDAAGLSILPTTGNVGIGTISPSTKLDLSIDDNTYATAFTIKNINTGTQALAQMTISTASNPTGAFQIRQFNSSGHVEIANYSNALMSFWTNGTEKVRIAADGKMGVGVTNATQTLQVLDAVWAQGTTNGVAYYMSGSNAIRSSGTIYIDADTNGANGFTRGGTGDIILRTANANQRMKINGSGNVSIGLNNNADTHLLDVTGTIFVNGLNQNLYIGGITNSGGDGIRIFSGGDSSYIDTKGGTGLHFRINDTDGGSQHMRLNTSGNLSIGLNNNANTYKLDVAGIVRAVGITTDVVTVTTTGTLSWDYSAGANAVMTGAATGNVTINISNWPVGGIGTFLFRQGTSTARTCTLTRSSSDVYVLMGSNSTVSTSLSSYSTITLKKFGSNLYTVIYGHSTAVYSGAP